MSNIKNHIFIVLKMENVQYRTYDFLRFMCNLTCHLCHFIGRKTM